MRDAPPAEPAGHRFQRDELWSYPAGLGMWVRPATLITGTLADARTVATPVAEASAVFRARTVAVNGTWVVKITLADAPAAKLGIVTQPAPFWKTSVDFFVLDPTVTVAVVP